MNTTLVINTKGGVGKTTISTNLATYFAAQRIPTTIMDYDPQGSSLHWLRLRPPEAAPIHGANAVPTGGGLQSFARYIPSQTEQLILDAPGGASKLMMQELLRRASCIVIPVAPSAIDIHASANFIKDLLLMGRVRHRNTRLAVVANRVRSATKVYAPLERFVASLGLSFLTRIFDSELYVEVAENGQGIFDVDAALSAEQRRDFLPIARWVEKRPPASAVPASSNIVPLWRSGA